MENREQIEARLENMEKVYSTLNQFIDEMPAVIPQKTRQMIKDSVFGDAELKALLEETKKQRPPRLFIFGRTGVGKSSLVNALCGAYITEVSDTESCTKETSVYSCVRDGRVLLEVMDTRGIAESEAEAEEAERHLFRDLIDFAPDALLLVLSCVHRDSVDEDIDFAKKLKKAYYEENLMELPVVIAVNKADAVPPVREVDPNHYSAAKQANIEKICSRYRKISENQNLRAEGTIAVSSLMDWSAEEGITLTASSLNQMSSEERNLLTLDFDGRWNMDKLLDLLENALSDASARAGLRMALRFEEIVTNLAKHIVDMFSGIAGTIALTPIPVADLYVLLALQSVMVGIIAVLSGREANLQTAKEFIFSLGGVGGAGLGFRLLAQQSSKLLNGLFPGAGSVISTTVAASGTKAIGSAAIAYYLN